MPIPGLNMKSPLQSLFHSSPNYSKLRTFGCLCFPWLAPYVYNKLLPKSKPCIFLGYSSSQSAYLCYNFKNEKLYTFRHVHFVENVFPYSSTLTTTSSLSPTSIPTCIQPSGPTPSNHIQIIPTPISQNSNSISTVSSLPTTSPNLSSPISMPTSLPTSSPPHVLPNSTKSSPPSIMISCTL